MKTHHFDLVILGASGDLVLKKLFPSLLIALSQHEINVKSRIFLCSRKVKDSKQFKAAFYQKLQTTIDDKSLFNKRLWQALEKRLFPVEIDITKQAQWAALAGCLSQKSLCPVIFYLALPPRLYSPCLDSINAVNLGSWPNKIVLEKPVGHSFQTASNLMNKAQTLFAPSQLFFIDHYLAKETVLNLQVLRFSNILFKNFWDPNLIDHIQISINETGGVRGRAEYYNEAGALKDMVQSHLLQLLSIIAMDIPNELTADAIHAEKIKVLKALKPLDEADIRSHCVRGQYVAGVQNDELEVGYLEDVQLPKSNTETFVALKVHIDNWQWAKTPFYLRTGKRLHQKKAQIVIQFKDVPHNLFTGKQAEMTPNRLIIQLQPEEKLQLSVMAKNMTDGEDKLKTAVLDFNFTDHIPQYRSYAYKRLLIDIFQENHQHFPCKEEIELAWKWIDPIIAAWQQNTASLMLYRAGTAGPHSAEALLAKDGRSWVD